MRDYMFVFLLCVALSIICILVCDVHDNYIYERQMYDYQYGIREYGFWDIANKEHYTYLTYDEYMRMLECWENGGDVRTVDIDLDKVVITKR